MKAAVPAHSNPFRVGRLHALEFRFPAGDGPEALLSRVRARGGRGAIVGPHGSGKTTLLEELAVRLRDDGMQVRRLRIGRERHALSATERSALIDGVGPRDAVLLDGAGHLLPWAWWAIRRRARAAGLFVITAHHRGRLPTVLQTGTSPALLVALCRELGETLTEDDATGLLSPHRGDIRAALRELYDRRAAAVDSGPCAAPGSSSRC